MYYFIVNKSSRTGKGAEIWKNIRKILKIRDVKYSSWETMYKGHATELAKKICNMPDEEINLIVLGGDGTVNEVINGMCNFHKVNFGIIPTGSGNDFARGLNIKCTPEEQLGIILNSRKTETIDIGLSTYGNVKRYFAISSGIGLDAIVCKKALTSKLKTILNKLHLGKLTYIILTIQTLFSMTTADITISYDGKKRKCKKMIFAAAMNFRAEGGGVPMAPRADAKDGLLSVCCVHGIPKWRTFFCLPLLVMAKHERIKGFDIVNCKKCHLKSNRPMVLHADGEYCEDVKEVNFECIPEKLRLIV